MSLPFFSLARIALAVALLMLVTLGYFTWQRFFPAQLIADDWNMQVVHENITKAAAIAQDEQGNLLVAEELDDNQGRIIRITPNGQRSVVVDGLNKPNGIVAFRGGIAFSQEGGSHPVYWLHDGKLEALFSGTNVQGLAVSGDSLYAVEDRKQGGRILRFDAVGKRLQVLRSGLRESETVAICPNGRKFFSKKAVGEIRELHDDGSDSVYLDSLNQPSYLRCDANGLWISEDSTHRARLLRSPLNGTLETIMSFLRAPQMLFALDDNRYLLAEGGRDRIIMLNATD